MANKVLIISFSFEQEPDAFQALRDAGLEIVLWADADRKGATEDDLVAYYLAMEEKPVAIVMGADIEITDKFLSVAKGLKMRSDCSLVDYLLGRMTLKELLRPTEVENLFIIPGGSGDSKAADLLNQERGLGMIQAARKLFDFVILDTPPCSMLADTGEVAALADAGLLVVRQDFASRDQILDGVQRMGDADLPMMGWVFNHTKRSLSYNYGSYGYYGYSYGYGKK
jgi:MinD-like ATPase involved in chromosome partitioning or flagellar assembly